MKKFSKIKGLRHLLILWIMWIKEPKLCDRQRKWAIKNPHPLHGKYPRWDVDNVDNLRLKKFFTDLIHISGAHSYQQVIVHDFFG